MFSYKMSNSDLCCVVCEEYYGGDHLPRVLLCGHTFCTPCIHKVLQLDKKCPECREIMSKGKAESFPVNYTVLRISKPSTASSKVLDGAKDVKAEYVAKLRDDIFHAQQLEKRLADDVILLETAIENSETLVKNCLMTIDTQTETADILKNKRGKLIAQKSQLHSILSEMKQTLNDLNQLTTKKDMVNAIETVNKNRSEYDKVKLQCNVGETLTLNAYLHESVAATTDGKIQVLWNALAKGQDIYAISQESQPRWARVTISDDRILLHSLQDGSPPTKGQNLPYQMLREMVPRKSPTVFLQVRGLGVQGNVFVRMFGYTPRSLQTTLLCSGERGPSYKNTVFYDVDGSVNSTHRIIRGGDYENNDGTGGRAIVDGITSGGIYKRAIKAGLWVSWPYAETWRLASFDIYLSDEPDVYDHSAHGIVTEGLEILKYAAKRKPVYNTSVYDCGLVIHA